MSNQAGFSDKEIEQIKIHLYRNFENKLFKTTPLLFLFCFIAPYIPGRRGRLIDDMEYGEAFILVLIFMTITLIATVINNHYQTSRKLKKLKIFLRKKELQTIVLYKQKGFLKKYKNKITTGLKNEFKILKVDEMTSQKLNINDKINIEFEEQTKTVFKIEKIKDKGMPYHFNDSK